MLERLHEHIIIELGQSSRTDSIFVVMAIELNLSLWGLIPLPPVWLVRLGATALTV